MLLPVVIRFLPRNLWLQFPRSSFSAKRWNENLLKIPNRAAFDFPYKRGETFHQAARGDGMERVKNVRARVDAFEVRWTFSPSSIRVVLMTWV